MGEANERRTVETTSRPDNAQNPRSNVLWPVGGGELGALIRSFDWARTSLGPLAGWPQSLKTTTDLLLQSPVPMVLLWGEDGLMIYNDGYSIFAGGRHPQLLGAKVREGWPEVADFNDHVMQVGLSGGTLAYTGQELTLYRTGAPEQVWMDLDYSPVLDESGRPTGVIAIVSETTERVRAEQKQQAAEAALRSERDRARGVLENMAEGFVLLDREFRVVDINAEGMRLEQRPREAILGKTHWEAWPDTKESEIGRLYQRAMADRTPATLEHCYAWEDGHAAWIDVRAYPTDGGLALFYRDVTERKHAEAALREESRTLETLNRTGEALSSELDLDRLVQRVTDAGVELTGAQFGAFFYNVLSDAGESMMLYTLSGVDRAHFDKFPMPRATAVFQPTFRGEGILRSDDILADPRYGKSEPHRGMPEGHLPVRSYLAVPVTSRSGEVLGGLFFGHEQPGVFTERHERLLAGIAGQAAVAVDNARLFQTTQRLNDTLEARVAERTAELEAAQEALRQAQKMEAVGQLTGGIAHDFNNLLQGITGSLDIVQKRVAQGRTGELDRFISGAMTSANRAAALTHRLLAFSRRQPLDPKPVQVNPRVASMEDLLRRTMGEQIELELVLAGGLWPTLCDPNQLESALLNLVINARDAMPDGGKLTIETCNSHLDTAYARVRDVSPGQYVCIGVTDTGSGMAPEVIERAFDPFYTTKPIGQGTGLGLSMIYGFARQSEGYAKIYSEMGQGTTVKLYLPRHRGAGREEELEQGPAEAPGAEHGEVVVVVEDEPVVRGLILEILGELGYRAIEASDGPAGLKLLDAERRVDLLVTDIGLPGLNGRQLADAGRVKRPGLKVLFMTGYAENAAIANGFLEPGMAMITKPFAMETLATRIRDIIEGR